jgi:predicted metal-dependent peptidase
MAKRERKKVRKTTAIISKAKRLAVQRLPYLGSLLWTARTIETDKVGTMAVDQYGRLYICPEFVEKLSVKHCAFVLLHEMLHIALSHPKRLGLRVKNPTQQQAFAWNIAADISVNEILQRDCADITLDACVRLEQYSSKDSRFQRGMSTEQYYELLMDQPDEPQGGSGGEQPDSDGDGGSMGQATQQQGSQPTGGSSADGLPRDYEDEVGMSDAIGQEGKLIEVEQAIERHEKESKGSVPGELKQSIKVRLHPMPDPFEQLRSAVNRSVASPLGDAVSTYRKVNRRQQHDMPRRRGEIRYAPECVVVVDTSGSMDCNNNKELALNAVAKGLRRVQRPRVICADGKVQSVKHITSMRSFEWIGGGGTMMDKAVEFADSEYRPDAIVLITDGFTDYPAKRTRARLIVGLVSDGDKCYAVPSWAKSIHCNKKGAQYAG